ncbi:DUF885 domain-containing protein [Pseudopontixanthobacter vadosimaris]|uniref:DUF885 domain-containing protein n=1 Tax=Pseudopontixanthobacter vadosimaris TaxID=2726450 RepID=UPI001F0E5913|nr:DUF885 domain-containing protein [Pseudopontixanthobacter vadosimaris]
MQFHDIAGRQVRTAMLSGAAALMFGCGASALAAPADDYRELRDAIWQDALDRDPLLATSVGDRRGDGRLGDNSLEADAARAAQASRFLARLEAIDASALPEDLAVDRAVVKRALEDEIRGAAFDQSRYMNLTNRGGWFSWFASLAYRSPFFTAADYESYVARLEAFPATNDAALIKVRGAVERGLTQPCIAMEGFADTVQAGIFSEAEASPYWQPFANRPPAVDETRWMQLQQRAEAALEEGVFPALQRFADYYTSDYAPACRSEAGISSTSGGAEYYRWLVANHTTTDLTPDQIHDIGLAEVARIRAEMESVAGEAGFASREAYIEHLRTDARYYAKSPEELMLEASALAKQIDGWMPRLFGTLPRQPYTVSPIPAAQAPGNTTAYYEPGSLDTGQPGIYRVNTTQLDQRPLWELPALGVHEAVPGHHHQIALQQELDLHPLRRNGTFFTAFVEGWGLYSESLGEEMGLYDTPARRMGQLSYDMWRAARLVVDTGMYAKGWSKERAVAFMADNTALSAANIDAEVNRYITWPGQALGYKIGQLQIAELRNRAETALGASFDLRKFHDAVLENGAIPLDVLERHIDRWIAAQRRSAR